MAAALLRTTSENNDNSTKLLVIAPETYQMRIQQVHALLKVLSARDRLLYTQIDLEYIPVGPIQYRKKVVDYSIDKSIAYIQSTMQRMSANRLTDDDVDRVNRSSTKLNENTKCHLLDSTIVNTTTAATFAGQPMVYILYTRAKLCAILDAHSADYSFDSSLLTDADYKTYAHHLSTAHAAVEVAREIIDYEQVAKVALERREPCLLVAFAVRLSRATMKVCDALRVKNYSAHIAFPRVYLLSTCELILKNTIYQLGISPLERM
ncbi:hypothetical protein BDF19DRAFT_422718 [Syncephalis fuscata]|nr:hypothetical protein BDF19DRAFT_422718 [Syncephalis fuscata]